MFQIFESANRYWIFAPEIDHISALIMIVTLRDTRGWHCRAPDEWPSRHASVQCVHGRPLTAACWRCRTGVVA